MSKSYMLLDRLMFGSVLSYMLAHGPLCVCTRGSNLLAIVLGGKYCDGTHEFGGAMIVIITDPQGNGEYHSRLLNVL